MCVLLSCLCCRCAVVCRGYVCRVVMFVLCACSCVLWLCACGCHVRVVCCGYGCVVCCSDVCVVIMFVLCVVVIIVAEP